MRLSFFLNLLSSQKKYSQYLSIGDVRLLHNSMTFDLGLSNPTIESVHYLIREMNYMVRVGMWIAL